MTNDTGYKITSASMTTHGDYQWVLGEERTTDGTGELCGTGWLHFYHDPLLAVLLNPIHANIPPQAMRLFQVRVAGTIKHDRGLKAGCTAMTLATELPVPVVTTRQRVAFARGCADWAALAAKGPRMTPVDIAEKLAELARKAVA
jgi:hypothetical protein